jgi:uncharacterized membrane protein YidH (DUF202 family)
MIKELSALIIMVLLTGIVSWFALVPIVHNFSDRPSIPLYVMLIVAVGLPIFFVVLICLVLYLRNGETE